MLNAKIYAVPEGYAIELVNPRSPNGRGYSYLVVASLADLIELRKSVDAAVEKAQAPAAEGAAR